MDYCRYFLLCIGVACADISPGTYQVADTTGITIAADLYDLNPLPIITYTNDVDYLTDLDMHGYSLGGDGLWQYRSIYGTGIYPHSLTNAISVNDLPTRVE